MGFFSVVLGVLVGGYGLGIWTASSVFRERQSAYEDGHLEPQLQQTSLLVLTVKNLAPAAISALEKVGVTAFMPKEAGASQAAVGPISEAPAPKVMMR
jgi:hypothetical protein